MQGGRPFAYNTSINNLSGDAGASNVEGLRKLALSYKSTMKGKQSLEKYHNATKPAQKSVDPRFRRARVAPTCEIMTRSDTKVPSPFHPMRHVPKSAPTVSSMPSSPKHSPRKKNKYLLTKMRSQITADAFGDLAADLTNKLKQESCGTDENIKNRNKPRPFRRMHSFIERTDTKEQRNDDAFDVILPVAVENKKIVENCEDPSEPQRVKDPIYTTECASQIPSGNGSRVLNTYIPPPIEIKTQDTFSKSMVTLPLSTISTEEKGCVCRNCSRMYNIKNKVSWHCKAASFAGTDSIFKALEYSQHQEKHHDEIWIVWCLYVLGCICGLLLVSSLVWVLSNEMLWNWVYPPKEPPPQSPSLYSFFSNCGATIIFTVNLFLSTVYKIMALPRSSVFGAAGEETDLHW